LIADDDGTALAGVMLRIPSKAADMAIAAIFNDRLLSRQYVA
jgi:hypothetical protein